MSIEILASKLPMLWVLIGVYQTCSFSVALFLLSKMFDVGDRDLPVLTSSN